MLLHTIFVNILKLLSFYNALNKACVRNSVIYKVQQFQIFSLRAKIFTILAYRNFLTHSFFHLTILLSPRHYLYIYQKCLVFIYISTLHTRKFQHPNYFASLLCCQRVFIDCPTTQLHKTAPSSLLQFCSLECAFLSLMFCCFSLKFIDNP